jgi:hypothetical protein
MRATLAGLTGRIVVLALWLAGCSGAAAPPNHDIRAKNYDRKCATVADCLPIIEGTAGCCGFGIACPNTAINRGALETYVSDVQSATTCAAPPQCPNPGPQGPCSGRIACTAGLCALEPTTADATTAD